MINNPIFSIITVCYNCEDSIAKTMNSVLEQEYDNYEYIIIDGASTDKTVDVIKQFEPLFKGKLKWISEPDKGIYDAFTKGVQLAKGNFVWIVNSDDYIMPDALNYVAHIYGEYEYKKAPVISGAMNFVDSEGRIKETSMSKEADLENAFYKDDIGVTHPATIVPKYIYDTVGAFDIEYRLAGDVDWFHRAYMNGCQFMFVDKVLTNMSDGGISSQYNWKRYKISLNDRMHYLYKFYPNPVVRNIHLLRWNYGMIKLLVKGVLMKLI